MSYLADPRGGAQSGTMQPRVSRSLILPSPDATRRFATALAPLLRPGDTLLLQGGLGAGKTHFARSLIQARLAVNDLVEDVPSPTFTLVQTYWDGAVEIWHCDLYRLSGPDEVFELGLDEAFDSAICLIEWPERLGQALPGALRLKFEMGADEGVRRVDIAADSPRWGSVFEGLDLGVD